MVPSTPAFLKDWPMAKIDLIDVSMRDGNQSLWGGTGLSTRQMLEIAGQVDRVGFRAIDFTASSHMQVAVRYFQDNPWERIRRARAAMPRTPLQFITTGLRFIAWEKADPEFMRIVYRRLMANGIRRFMLLDAMHDFEAVLETAQIVKQEGDAETIAALTYTLSAIHDDAFYADYAATLAASPNVDAFYIKDPSGLLTPERARTLVPAVKAAIGTKRLEVHSHCTIGLGAMASLAAAEAGADGVHVGIGPLGNGTSLPEASRMVANLRELGHDVDIDDVSLERVSRYWSRLAKAEGLAVGVPQDFDASFLKHQIAGGVMTTIVRQLKEVNLEHRFSEVIAETAQVRADLGYPIMVTPFPQMVCSQALFNIISGKRYSQVSDQVVRYVMGRFGRPTRPVAKDVEAAILDRPRAREIEREPAVLSLSDMRKRFPATLSEEEFLLRAVMPADQVDAMLAKGPSRARYSSEATSIIALLKELAARPAANDIVIERPGIRIALHAGASLK
jgi:oxaloacetate decarboxylase (Na+ extruding) subunit alpha